MDDTKFASNGRVGCVLTCYLNSAPYQVGALRALLECEADVSVVSGSGAGALNAMLLNSVGIDGLEHAWVNQSLYWRLALAKYWRLGASIIFIGGVLWSVLWSPPSPLILFALIVVAVIIWFGERAACRVLLHSELSSVMLDGHEDEVSDPGVKKRPEMVSITLSDRSYLFDPTDYGYLVPISSRGAAQLFSSWGTVLLHGQAKKVWFPTYKIFSKFERGSNSLRVAYDPSEICNLLHYLGSADPVPLKPALDSGCGRIYIVGSVAARGLRNGCEEREWFLEHARSINKKFLLKECGPLELVRRYNSMLAASGAECQWEKSPDYTQIGEDLLGSLGQEATFGLESADLVLVSGTRARPQYREFLMTRKRVVQLIAAGYSDMCKSLGESIGESSTIHSGD